MSFITKTNLKVAEYMNQERRFQILLLLIAQAVQTMREVFTTDSLNISETKLKQKRKINIITAIVMGTAMAKEDAQVSTEFCLTSTKDNELK